MARRRSSLTFRPGAYKKRRRSRAMRIYVDGCWVPGQDHVGCGIIIVDADGNIALRQSAQVLGHGSLQAEYEALLLALERVAETEARACIFHSDARILVEQVMGVSDPRDPEIAALCQKVRRSLGPHRLRWLPRQHNVLADDAARAALGLASRPALA